MVASLLVTVLLAAECEPPAIEVARAVPPACREEGGGDGDDADGPLAPGAAHDPGRVEVGRLGGVRARGSTA
ncbi:hypothetical protein QFZ22_006255 [Streptomyces canus]|uniref:Secreted protein n=1 Tax=Streptomyces canus TaxID=58343 RepID=A0AAW8FMB5_9ACTN|nr:hypothetical protein [Streptomyces canus]MDQ0910270.1 hypothetical protein [Streptomyces canus]